MIKNERQYKITKSQVDVFTQALTTLRENTEIEVQTHPLLHQAQIDALQSQIEDLQTQIEEYEALKSGKYKVIELNSFEAIPQALIQARIASGLSQKELAEKLGLKEQQIQRYEATDYSSASFGRIKEVIDALDIIIQENILLPNTQISWKWLLKRLKEIGVDQNLVVDRIIPSALVEHLQEDRNSEDYGSVLKAASIIGKVFNWPLNTLFGPDLPQLDAATVEMTRFKKAANANERKVSAYTLYAHYLALLVLDATPNTIRNSVPSKADDVRKAIIQSYGSLSMKNMLNYIWDLGIPILPLNDSGAFHGACWRIDGRNIIVLKQQTNSEARWLFDLLHELGHARQNPDKVEFGILESGAIGEGSNQAKEEQEASRFAGDVLLDNRAEELTEKCVQAAGGAVERLKTVVPKVALQENFPTDVLANYVAFRLSLQRLNWWGTAQNLQTPSTEHWELARDILLERVNLVNLNEVDRDLLIRAISSPGV